MGFSVIERLTCFRESRLNGNFNGKPPNLQVLNCQLAPYDQDNSRGNFMEYLHKCIYQADEALSSYL